MTKPTSFAHLFFVTNAAAPFKPTSSASEKRMIISFLCEVLLWIKARIPSSIAATPAPLSLAPFDFECGALS